ncbi:hypothetical protein PGT21_003525 [Puccinia graminis f. sp. tritici]|uniref:Tyrosine specific protein phosphatases domain-containing protein n=2 Tax=Puccinia graminis f. sp. tritici TaxID=56615 RepID=E3K9M8_PUCGT|nr:uncharacterized protein PGTG_07166 [Puccinia graminis f. sp. tritici CRL 75-36-700-3]EFP80914.2 hypothetical protein PGTG_07166 [Puccinia graminis f. sp. tritici CRL 75-36-700-3]KAA1068842.1 hypothetical protein PGT21_003525 [Puccinia graminis f. sp. tritici]
MQRILNQSPSKSSSLPPTSSPTYSQQQHHRQDNRLRQPENNQQSDRNRSLQQEPTSTNRSPSRTKNPQDQDDSSSNMNMIWINTMKKRHRLLQRLSLPPQDSSSRPASTNTHNSPDSSDKDRDSDSNSTPKRAPCSTTTLDSANKILIAPLVPPLGFAMVAPGVYRSGHPNHCNFAFLDGLQLKSIMYICVDSYRPHTFNWAQDRGLKIFHYRIDSYKQPHSATSDPTERGIYASALEQILDRRNLPILVHCNKGKHRVGTLSALLRIIQGWDTVAVRAEWDKFLGEGAPPGKNMIWSPGLVFINNNHNNTCIQNHPVVPARASEPLLSLDALGPPPQLSTPTKPSSSSSSQPQKIKNKVADGLARISEWEYVEQFPIELIQVDPAWIPSWLPIESIQK